MKERILKVLMFFSILFAVGMTVFCVIYGCRTKDFLILTGMGVLVVLVTSGLQYILIAEWNPMYLFKKK